MLGFVTCLFRPSDPRAFLGAHAGLATISLSAWAEPLPIECNGSRTRRNLDVLKSERFAVSGTKFRIADWAATAAIIENDLRTCRLSQPVVTPFFQRQIGREEITALLRQYIFVAPRMFRQRYARHDSGVDELFQTRAQDVGRQPDIILEFVEALGAVIRLSEQQNRPAISDCIHGPRDRALLVGNTASTLFGHPVSRQLRCSSKHGIRRPCLSPAAP